MAFVPTTRAEVRAWLQQFHGVNDGLDPTKLPAIYAKDAKVQFGNKPLLEGLDALGDFMGTQWAGLDSMLHEVGDYNMIGNTIYQPCHITWVVKNDPEKEKVKVPAFAAIHLVVEGEEKGLIQSAEYYMDGSPLTAAFQRASSQ
ncbi:hypothetical protein HD806DRAFT_486558 [Xylariaceae sp. AK1471]|nr:hypothetical protein HD806DRAFT_486558 [Xylariaceae sp. AK1471]